MHKEIFLSHAERDAIAAKHLADWLSQLFRVDVFDSSVPSGADFHYEIVDALRNCKVAVLLATDVSLSRPWVHYEAGAVSALGKLLIPLCVGGVCKSQLPSNIQNRNAVEYENDDEVREMLLTMAKSLNTDYSRTPDILNRVPSRPTLKTLIGLWRPPEPAGIFSKRKDATTTVIPRLLKSAGESKQTICFLGIAHSDLYGTHPVLNRQDELEEAIKLGATIKIIFLDPESPAAARRAIHEKGALDPRIAIRHSLEMAKKYRNRFPGRFQCRLTPEIPPYICFNDDEMVLQPYLNSNTGHEVAALWVSREAALFRWGKQHFDQLWNGTKQVLFDLGNVLINFDHRVVSQKLYPLIPKNRRRMLAEVDIHNFIFGGNGSLSPNGYLDRGQRTLEWLRDQLISQFHVEIGMDQFHDIWMSVFSAGLNQRVIEALSAMQKVQIDIAICSNTNREHWEGLLARHGDLKKTEESIPCHLSYKMGKLKTDLGYFDAIADAKRHLAEHQLLIDDRLENCRAAEAAGMYAVQFSTDLDGSLAKVHSFLETQCWNSNTL